MPIWTTRWLSATVDVEHGLVLDGVRNAFEHAVLCGLALLAAQEIVPQGEWMSWLETNVSYSGASAFEYMRIATFQDVLRTGGYETIAAARKAITELGLHRTQRYLVGELRNSPTAKPVEREMAEALVKNGASFQHAAKMVGVAPCTVSRWVDPKRAQRVRTANAQRKREHKAAAKALADQERAQIVKRAVRKAGGAHAELYTMAERMQDVMAQAHREATDSAARREYALAGEHYRKMRDHIVAAVLTLGPLPVA